MKRKFTKQLKATQPIDENESEEDASSEEREISATPIQMYFKELYGDCYPHTLAAKSDVQYIYFQSRGSSFVLGCSHNVTKRNCVWK